MPKSIGISLLNVCKQHSLIDLFSDQVLINYTSYIKWLLSVYHKPMRQAV